MDEDIPEVQIIKDEEGEEFNLIMECETYCEEPEEGKNTPNRPKLKKIMKQISSKLVEVPVRGSTSEKALFDGKFFTVVSEFYTENKYHRKIRKIKAKCLLCTSKPTYITCSYDSTSNFLRHIRLKHGRQAYDAYLAYKKCKVLGKTRDQSTSFNITAIPDTPAVCRMLEPPSQDKVQRLVDRFQIKLLKFMINCMQPLSLVDDSNFRDLFPDVLTPTVNSTAVGAKIAESFNTCREKLTTVLQDVKYLCLTIDIWTDKLNSFVGFASHWMDDEFVKKSAVLACSRIVSTTSENVLHYMNEVLKTYNLKTEQVVGVVTNNGCSYAKALRKLEIHNYKHRTSSDSSATTDASLSTKEEPEIIADGNFEFHELEVNAKLHDSLKNMKNVCYMLNTIAVEDFGVLLDNCGTISDIHEDTMKKCNILWNFSSVLNVKERISQIIGRELPLPRVTSWISAYHSLKALLDVRHKLPQVCQELKIEEFLPKEIKYLGVYTNIMKPIAAAIETLEGDSVFFGYVLPTLLTIKLKLKEMGKSEDPESHMILQFMLEKFEDKFQPYLTLDMSEICVRHAILAAVSHPKLKLRWISNYEKAAEVKRLLIDESLKFNVETENVIEEVEEDDDFFAACLQSNDDTPSVRNEAKSSAEVEVLRFLASKNKSMEMLNSFPSVKLLFLKYNTLLTSPSPVDKLFSFESLMCRESTPTAEELQAYLFLKGNISLVL